jgi:hypothetical protein
MTTSIRRFALSPAAGRAAYDGFGGATLAAITGLHAGTMVATPSGTVAAERLQAGDLLLDRSGGEVEVVEVTTRLLQPETTAIDLDCRPVRLRAGVIGVGVPVQDLLLAPGQALRIDGAVVAAADLVNGVSVLREPAGSDAVRYVRIGLAGGLARGPGGVLAEGVECLVSGRAATGDRVNIAAPSGFAFGPLTGNIAHADHAGVAGWAMDTLHPGMPVALEVIVGGRVVARALADRRRPDLEMAGLGDGRCGFDIRFARKLPAGRDHVLLIRRADDAADVPGSPLLLRRPLAAVDVLAAILLHDGDVGIAEAERLAEGLERLLQARVPRPR